MVYEMTWHWAGNKPLPDPMMTQTSDATCHYYAAINVYMLDVNCILEIGYIITLCHIMLYHVDRIKL